MKYVGLFLPLLFIFNAEAGTFKCDQLVPACEHYLNIKNANPTEEFPEQAETCELYLYDADPFNKRRCNFCQVVSDLESHTVKDGGDNQEEDIPNLEWFNSLRPDFKVDVVETDQSCNEDVSE